MSIKKQVQRFWKIFLEERLHLEKALRENDTKEIEEIVKILNTYFEEFSNSSLEIALADDFYELTFFSNQDKNVQLICVLLKAFTPIELKDKWIVNAFVPPLSEKALNTVLRIENEEYVPDDFIVYYEIDEASKVLHYEVYCSAFAVMDPNKAKEIAIYMVQSFIGECMLEAYVGSIDVIDSQKSGEFIVLPQLYEMMIDIVEEKEWTEYQDPTQIYRAYQLQEDKVENKIRKDMKFIFTTHPILISEVLNDEFLSYHQFFDYGGEFGYVYYKHNNAGEADAIYRQHLEKKLNDLLFEAGIAKSIGGAIGTTYAYVDLAIYDKEEFLKALEVINKGLSVQLNYSTFEEDHEN